MVATTVRDKYVQSEKITGQAEEAGELMTRMEQSDEILSQRLTVIWQEWKQVFFSHIRWEQMTPTASLSLSRSPLYQSRPERTVSRSLSNSICHFSVTEAGNDREEMK